MVKITETILRDAHQSLIATRMRTRDMLPIIEQLDEVGYNSLEMWGGATFDVCIRYLNENPWERLRLLKKGLKKTPTQMLLRGQNLVGYRHYSDEIVGKFITKACENGMDIFRIFDALNDIRNLKTSISAVKREGAHAQGTICYTTSPVHTIDKYVEFAKELSNLGCDSIAIKDMAGLITPHYAYELVKEIKKETALPVNLHSHCTTGLATMSYLAACKAGVDIIDTAISPFSGGTSQPPTESVVFALKNTPYDPKLDIEKLSEIATYFKDIKKKYKGILNPISEEINPGILISQVPGGMLSNLVSQLKEQDALDKYDAVLKEMPLVRADMGYPPLVTPLSQMVGTQSVLNVLMGERYKVVSKEVKEYLRGFYGKSPATIDRQFIKKIIGNENRITCRPADLIEPEYEKYEKELKEEHGLVNIDEECVLSYVIYPPITLKLLKGEAKEEELLPAHTLSEPIINAIPAAYNVEVDGEVFNVKLEPIYDGSCKLSENAKQNTNTQSKKSPDDVICPMQGVILSVEAKIGALVEKGDTICVVEAMKMESVVNAPHGGIVGEIFVNVGDAIKMNDAIMRIDR